MGFSRRGRRGGLGGDGTPGGHRRAHGQRSGAVPPKLQREPVAPAATDTAATSATVPAPPPRRRPRRQRIPYVNTDRRRQRRRPNHRAPSWVHRHDRREAGHRAAHPFASRAPRARRLRAAVQFLLRYVYVKPGEILEITPQLSAIGSPELPRRRVGRNTVANHCEPGVGYNADGSCFDERPKPVNPPFVPLPDDVTGCRGRRCSG